MEMIILDENLQEIERYNIINDSTNYNIDKNMHIPHINKENKEILNRLDSFVSVYYLSKKSDNFYVSFINKSLEKFNSFKLSDIQGAKISDVYSSLESNNTLLKVMKNVYNTNQDQILYLEYYENDIFQKRLIIKIFKNSNFIYIMGKEKKSLTLNKNLNEIQRISKTFLSYTNKEGTLNWSDSTFDILKIDKNMYKNYHRTFLEFVINEDKLNWKKTYKKCSVSSPKASTIIRIINGNNKLIYIKAYIVCDYDKKGNERSHMTFYQDITEQIERENRLKEVLDNSLRLEENFKKIQGISKTTMCYINDNKDKDFIWFNNGYNILGLKYDQYNGNMSEYLIDEDKIIWANAHKSCTPENPETSFVQRAIINNNLIYIKTYVAYEFDENGNKKSHVSLLQDITEEVKKENRLKKSLNRTLKLEDTLNRIQKSSKTAISYFTDLGYFNWTPEIFDILEINKNEYIKDNVSLIEQFIDNNDLKIRQEYISKISSLNPDIEFIQKVKTGKGIIKYIRSVIHHEYDNKGNFIERIDFNQDVTREINYQNQLKEALNEKEILLSEVHHRVKNNLQIILSLINLDKNYESNPKTILNDTENRIYAMALIHEKIYGSNSLSDVNIKEYVESLVNSLMDIYDSDISFYSNIDSIEVDMNQSIPLGLIINELVTNSIKYAFPYNKYKKIYIEFKKENDICQLIFKDNGKGLPDNFNLDNINSLGLLVVKNLTYQIGGTLSKLDCNGTGFKIEFDLKLIYNIIF